MVTWVKPTGDTAMRGRSMFSQRVAALAPLAPTVAGRWVPSYHADQASSRAKSLGREKTTTMPPPPGADARWVIGVTIRASVTRSSHPHFGVPARRRNAVGLERTPNRGGL